MFLKNIKLSELEKGKKYSFLIPIGSTEQHGPFIPLGTDTYLTDEIVKGIEKSLPDIIVTPTLEFSCSKEHEGFMGTVWLEPETLADVLSNMCQSLSSYARDIFLITAHGGNGAAFELFFKGVSGKFPDTNIQQISIESEDIDKATKEMINGPIDAHAGNTEISMMFARFPHLTICPAGDYPKVAVHKPWETGRLIDKSCDGIADTHDKWVIDKDIGEKIFSMIIEKAVNDINLALRI